MLVFSLSFDCFSRLLGEPEQTSKLNIVNTELNDYFRFLSKLGGKILPICGLLLKPLFSIETIVLWANAIVVF